MKKILIIIPLVLAFYGCPFTYDPPKASIDIRNYSDKPVYVYSSWNDSLALFPSLSLFEYVSYPDTTITYTIWRSADTIWSPSYRIDAYGISAGIIHVSGSYKNPAFPNKTDTLTLFFIMEEIMQNHSWEEIWHQQMYVKKVSFSENDMKDRGWVYTYYP